MSADLVFYLTVFVLSLLVGFEVISKVPATLHTPLMSGANSIHGIVVVGAMLIATTADNWVSYLLAFVAMAFAWKAIARCTASPRTRGAGSRSRRSAQCASATMARRCTSISAGVAGFCCAAHATPRERARSRGFTGACYSAGAQRAFALNGRA